MRNLTNGLDNIAVDQFVGGVKVVKVELETGSDASCEPPKKMDIGIDPRKVPMFDFS